MTHVNYRLRAVSGAMTLMITLIGVTPLCGFLFQCGCDWPWLGLDADCNYYKPHATHQCPWCVSMATGIISTGLSVIGGVCMAVFFMPLKTLHRPVIEVLVRTVFGFAVFVSIAIFFAGFAAIWQGYPIDRVAIFL